jgi:uncharacterized repeat protein (TIGR03803 family)
MHPHRLTSYPMRFLASIVLACLIAVPVTAQVFYGVTRAGGSMGGGTIFRMSSDGAQKSTEYNFAFDGYIGRNFDYCQMVKAPNGKMYGVTPNGGQGDTGVLFEFDPSTSAYFTKYEFNDETVGINPFGSLVFGPNGNLYGTTNNGGSHWNGTIFEFDISTSTMMKRADFEAAVTGQAIYSGMVLANDGKFYGVALVGGANNFGTLYQFDPISFNLTKKQDFTASGNGSLPLRVPVLYDNKLYGTTLQGGTGGFGTIYEYDPAFDVLNMVYEFTNTGDGKGPNATMTVVGSLLYGVTSEGGFYNNGTIYEFDPLLGSVTAVADFESGNTGEGDVNIMQMAPNGKLYGTSEYGGAFNAGTLFEFDPTTYGLNLIEAFTGTNGAVPKSGLTLATSGVLYGTTAAGGTNNAGVLFSIDPSDFAPIITPILQSNYSSTGAYPVTPPVQHTNGKLYGVTPYGGTVGGGILYEFDPITKEYQVAYEFGNFPDGSRPEGSLTLHPNGFLYGMAQSGGLNGHGLIYQFDPSNFSMNTVIDFDGALLGSSPHGSLIVADNGIMYGLTSAGGANNSGVLFNYDPGVFYNKLFDFGGIFGVAPQGDLVQATNGKLYGTAQFGGANNRGVVFEYDIGASSIWIAEHFTLNATGTGAEPTGSMVLNDDGKLYALTSFGGAFNAGTLYMFDPSSLTSATLVDFDYGPTGGVPRGTLARGAGNLLYGYTAHGGNGGWGVVFEFNPSGNVLTKKFDLTPETGATPMSGALTHVALPPTITSLTPPSAQGGASVFIAGTNFSPDPSSNMVYFGAAPATVLSATLTQLEVTVPFSAEFGPVSVTVAGLTAESTTPFTPTFFFRGWIPGSFETLFTKAGGTSDKRAVLADLDGDGNVDAVMGDAGSAVVHVYHGASTVGNVEFEDKVDFPVSVGPYTVDVADLDGDGKLDIIAACSSGFVTILRNQSTSGSISFAAPVDVAFGAVAISLTTGDVNDDGRPEIVAVGNSTNIFVYENLSSPGVLNFSNAAFSVESTSGVLNLWDVAVADVDRDGKLDIVVPVPDDPVASSYAAIFLNTTTPGGSPSFAPPVKISAPGYSAGLDVADLDADGYPELIVGSGPDYQALRVYKNLSTTGSISFGPSIDLPASHHVWDPKVGEVTGDGKPDILAAFNGNGRIAIFTNHFAGGALQPSDFTHEFVTTGGGPLNVQVCDLDKDGLPELVVANENANVLQVFVNTNAYPPPTINSVTPAFAAVGASVDIEGFNFASIPENNTVFFGATQATVTAAGSGDGLGLTTSLTVTVPPGATYASVSVTANGLTGFSPDSFAPDFSTSGVIDANAFEPKVDETTGASPLRLAVGDLNADGLSDLVIPNSSDATISVMQNLSTTGASDFFKVDFSAPVVPISAAIGDLDGDQLQDFVVTSNDGLELFYNTGNPGAITAATFAPIHFPMPASTDDVALGDVDGDGKLDIVAVSTAAGLLFIIKNLANPWIVPIFVDPNVNRVALGDLDRDGRLDIVVGYSEATGTSTLFSVFQNSNDPGGIFADRFTRVDLTAGTRPLDHSLTDVDGDGKLDIVIANHTGASVSVLRNITIGPGTISGSSFEAAVNYTTGVNPTSIACADVDGDLRPDIVTSNAGDGTLSILKNIISSPGALSAGSFLARIDFATGSTPHGLVIADTDNDGKSDIIVTSVSDAVVSVLLNAGELGTPALGAIENVTTTSFKANWTPVSGATEYQLDVSSDNFVSMVAGYDGLVVSGIETSATASGLTSGLTYKFRIRAANGTGASANSSEGEVTLLPEPPQNLSFTLVGQTSFVALWDAATGATGYLLDVSSDDFVNFAVNGLSVVGTSHEVTGLVPGSIYEFRLRTQNSIYTSTYSSELGVQTIPSAPDATAATDITVSSFTANWNNTSESANYKLDVSGLNDFSTFVDGYENLQLSEAFASVIGLDAGATYYYRVSAGNAMGDSEESDVESVILVPPAPLNLSYMALDAGSFVASWDAAQGATGYLLDVSTNEFVSNITGYDGLVVSGTSQSVDGLASGTNYKVRVRATNGSGTSANSAELSVLTLPAPPVATDASGMTATTFIANWETSSGAGDYLMDVASVNDFTIMVSGYENLLLASNSVAVSGLTPGSTYYYRVRARNTSGTSLNSNAITVLLLPAAPGTTAATGIGQTGFTANWVAAAGATEYRLDVSDNDFVSNLFGYDDLVVPGIEISKGVTGLVPGTTYKYRVRAINTTGVSVDSDQISVITVPPAPVANPATGITQSSFQANWTSALGADGYHVDVYDDFSTLLPDYNNFPVNGNSLDVTGLTAGATYHYEVRAVNASGASDFSEAVTVSVIPGEPTALAATNAEETTFTANWNGTTGAINYEVDVSDDNFTSVLPGYEGLSSTTTSLDITGLDGGNSYMYRVRAGNGGGFSSNSNVISVQLKPGAPVASEASGITQTAFTANWSVSNGATSYRLEVSGDDFLSNLDDYDAISLVSTSLLVSTGLEPGLTYKYRVRGENVLGVSGLSNEISVTLIPATPVATEATNVSLTSFTANWGSATGAIDYRLDVSADNFSTYVSGYENRTVTGLSEEVAGLTTLQEYKYRVRASNGSGDSPDSSPISVTPDSPADPTVTGFSPPGGPVGTLVAVTGTNFIYPLQVDFNGVMATSIVQGSTPSTTFSVAVPAAATSGKIRVVIGTAAGISANDFIVDNTPPVITLPASPSAAAGQSFQLDITIVDAESQDNVSAAVYYRSVAGDDDFGSPIPLMRQATSTTYRATIPSTFITSAGAEYFLEASSYGGQASTESTVKTVQVDPGANGLSIPYSAFGDEVLNYRIISIPLVLTGRSVADVFHDDLTASTKKNWRLQRYTNGATNDLGASSLLAPGEGYWLIVRESVAAIDSGPGKTVPATRDNPFQITLKPGWNQIGNPYDFNLYWPDVVAANTAESTNFSGTLNTYRGGWDDHDILNRFEGAFINNTATSDIVLTIPAQKNIAAGRVNETMDRLPLDGENWKVDFLLKHGDNFTGLSGFGMHKDSQTGQDRYDVLSMPRFFDKHIEINHTRKTTEDPLSTDIVPTASAYVWEFDVESNFDGDIMVLEWDNSYFGDNQKNLVLWDEQLQLGTDMRLANRYEFKRSLSKRFKVFFGGADEVADHAAATRLVFHSVSPNPTEGDVKVTFSVPSDGEVIFDVYDLVGRKVWSDAGTYSKGYHEVDLTGRFSAVEGTVILRLVSGSQIQQKRLQIR